MVDERVDHQRADHQHEHAQRPQREHGAPGEHRARQRARGLRHELVALEVHDQLILGTGTPAGVALLLLGDGLGGGLSRRLGHAPSTIDSLNHYIELNTAVIKGVRPSLPNLLTAVVEGESVVSGKDANGHYVRVLALSGACTAAPDPSRACSMPGSTATAPAQPAVPSLGATGGGSAGPGSHPVSYSALTDDQLSALFLGS